MTFGQQKRSYCRVSHNRLPDFPGQPFLPVGQRNPESFTIRLYIYVVGQPKCLVGQPQFDTGCPKGQPVFKTNVKTLYCKQVLVDQIPNFGMLSIGLQRKLWVAIVTLYLRGVLDLF